MITLTGCSSGNTDISKEIISLEKAALEKWNRGDIYGYLDLYAEDIVYFDPMIDKRMDGLQKIKSITNPGKGKLM